MATLGAYACWLCGRIYPFTLLRRPRLRQHQPHFVATSPNQLVSRVPPRRGPHSEKLKDNPNSHAALRGVDVTVRKVRCFMDESAGC